MIYGADDVNNSNPVFRKTVFGGFNREDVINYIEKLKNEFFEYKTNTDSIISGLYEKINSLNDLLEETSSQLQVLKDKPQCSDDSKEDISVSLNKISKEASEIKSGADLVCLNFEDLIKLMGSIDLRSEALKNEDEKNNEAASDTIIDSTITKSSFFDDLLSKVETENQPCKAVELKSVQSQFEDFFNI